jgi:hypothetical protein
MASLREPEVGTLKTVVELQQKCHMYNLLSPSYMT